MIGGRIISYMYMFHVRVQKDLSAELCLERKFTSYSGHGPVETTSVSSGTTRQVIGSWYQGSGYVPSLPTRRFSIQSGQRVPPILREGFWYRQWEDVPHIVSSVVVLFSCKLVPPGACSIETENKKKHWYYRLYQRYQISGRYWSCILVWATSLVLCITTTSLPHSNNKKKTCFFSCYKLWFIYFLLLLFIWINKKRTWAKFPDNRKE